MKTFRLKSLEIIENKDNGINREKIGLMDGLIINRDDEQWLIEAYVKNTYFDYFQKLKENNNHLMVEVKISKESNDPAIFITDIIGINDIGEHMNILFKGKIIDQRKSKIVDLLAELMDKGYEGDNLLIEFEQMLKRG